jgi:hypothetical protein
MAHIIFSYTKDLRSQREFVLKLNLRWKKVKSIKIKYKEQQKTKNIYLVFRWVGLVMAG